MRREGRGTRRWPAEQLLQLSGGMQGGQSSVRVQHGVDGWRRAQEDGEEERSRVRDAHLTIIICYMNLKRWKF
jgi:hypothetical protein